MIQAFRDLFLVLLITFIGLEAGLRLAPTVLPLSLLAKFSAVARVEIAERRNLPTKRRTIIVPRHDGGPPLRIREPYQRVDNLFTDRGVINSVTMDENGFCNLPAEPKVSHKGGFVAVGDSFTWCSMVRPQDTWVSQLSKLSGINGYNLGVVGVGIYEYLEILKSYGLYRSPSVVLLNYYEGNDLRDALLYQRYRDHGSDDPGAVGRVDDPGPVGMVKAMVRRVFDTPVLRSSYAVNLILAAGIEAYLVVKEILGPDKRINFRYHFQFSQGRIEFNLENTDVDEVEHARALADSRISMDVLEEGLRRFVELANQYRFEPVVLYTPSAYTAYTDYVKFEDPEVGGLMESFSQAQRNFLRVKSHTLGYRFVDLTPALQQAAREYRGNALLYFPTNVHLSQLGHKVVARELEGMLGTAVRRPSAVGGSASRSSVGLSCYALRLRDREGST